MTEKWLQSLEKGESYGVLLTDFSKAFEYLSHSQLIAKLHSYGFNMGQLKTLGTQMGYPIGVPIWVLPKNKSIKIIDNVVMVINNQANKQSKLPKIT